MAERNRRYYRYMREKHIKRKERIIAMYRSDGIPHDLGRENVDYGTDIQPAGYGDCGPFWHTKYRGTLSKGKIHCSCSLCAFHETPVQDKRKLESMIQEMQEADIPISGPFINKTMRKVRKYEPN